MITFSGVPASAAASGVYVEQENVKRGSGSAVITRRIIVVGQFNSGKSPTLNTPQLIISKEDAWERYGRGSLLAILLEIVLKYCGGSEVYALPVVDGTTANTWTLAMAGKATAAGEIALYIGGKKISIPVSLDDTHTAVATAISEAVNADLDLPLTASVEAGTITLTSRFKGEVANQIDVSLNLDDESVPAGLSAEITDNEAGVGDPSLTTALKNCKSRWFTDLANPYLSSANIGAVEAHGVLMDGAKVMKQFAGFVGFTGSISEFLTVLESRNSEWTTYIPVPGSVTPAYELAAIGAATYSAYHGAEPGRPVKNVLLSGAIAGNEDMSANKDTLVKAGGSWTINQEDGTVTVGDLCTTRTKAASGAETTDWRFTDIIANIQFKIYAVQQRFLQSPYDRGVVLSDDDGKGPTYGIRPKMVKQAGIGLVDDWISRGLSTDRKTIVENIVSEIDASNPGRINLSIPDIASAGLRILANKLEWGFLV